MGIQKKQDMQNPVYLRLSILDINKIARVLV